MVTSKQTTQRLQFEHRSSDSRIGFRAEALGNQRDGRPAVFAGRSAFSSMCQPFRSRLFSEERERNADSAPNNLTYSDVEPLY